MSHDTEQLKAKARRLLPYVLVLPVLLYYSAFWLRPVISAVYGSFVVPEKGFSLQYYTAIISDPVFLKALFNTGFIVLFSVTLEFILAFGLALLINKKFKGSALFLSVAMIPMALPPVALGAIWASGLVERGWANSLLIHLGIISRDAAIPFLAANDWWAMILIIFIDAWQVVPFMMIILLAGLQNLEREKVEAGYVFGGNPLNVCWKITIPILKPTIQTALLLRIISAIQIWLIIVMIFGFRRIPVLLEEVVFYQEQLSGAESNKIALAYSVIVAIVVSVISVLYLKMSGKSEPEKT